MHKLCVFLLPNITVLQSNRAAELVPGLTALILVKPTQFRTAQPKITDKLEEEMDNKTQTCKDSKNVSHMSLHFSKKKMIALNGCWLHYSFH